MIQVTAQSQNGTINVSGNFSKDDLSKVFKPGDMPPEIDDLYYRLFGVNSNLLPEHEQWANLAELATLIAEATARSVSGTIALEEK